MVLEEVVNPVKVTGKPWEMFFVGGLYALVGGLLGYSVFRSHVSLVMVSFTAIASVPFFHSAIMKEEEKANYNLPLIKKHGKIIQVFTYLFLGFVVTFLGMFMFFPGNPTLELFSAQVGIINEIRGAPTGSFTSSLGSFSLIMANNFKVLFFCVIFSFFYGAGAIFILSWNASVMGAAIGATMREGLSNSGSYIGVVSTSIMRYFAHGIPEMIAFLIAGLAGGIVSVALVQGGLKGKEIADAGKDALNLFGFASLLLVLAALIEVFVSPSLI